MFTHLLVFLSFCFSCKECIVSYVTWRRTMVDRKFMILFNYKNHTFISWFQCLSLPFPLSSVHFYAFLPAIWKYSRSGDPTETREYSQSNWNPWKHSKIATHLLSCHCLAPKFFSHNYRNDTPMFLLSFVLSFTQTYLLGFEFYFSWPCYVKTNDVALEKVMLFTTRCEPKSFLTFWSIDLSFFTFLFFLNMSLQWCIHCLFRLSISGERLTNSWNGGYNMCVLQGLLYRYIYVYYPTAIRAWMTALSER